ncbi:TonB-dependent receptor plug domain-containing protein [candidate division KSB1 bacterium]|nr:TonB-dependent receptor plug domain-containing protein [candidate division KSB1 bacterium]
MMRGKTMKKHFKNVFKGALYPALILFSILLIFTTGSIYAQSKGKISGKLVDSQTGDPLIYANVKLEGTSLGAASDLEGNYIINAVPPGNYTLIVQYIGYTATKITDVQVIAGEVTKVNASLSPEIIEGEEVVVTAKALNNTEASLLKHRQKALAVSDAISAEAISQAGAGDAAEAVKQITGASVVDGKYVYVRGLGDRYTSTQLNGASLPSTDPYKRSGSIDLVPTNLIDNIVTVKSFTPDKPGDFSGGTVDIKTKDFPEKLKIDFSTSVSYNTNTTFNDGRNTIGYSGGDLDWLGIDDGSRDVPDYVERNGVPYYDNSSSDKLRQLSQATKVFNRQMWTESITPGMNQSYSLSIGNQVNLLNRPFGFIGSFTYSNSYSAYDNGRYNAWNLLEDSSKVLNRLYNYNHYKTNHEVLWGTLLKGSYKLSSSDIVSFDFIYNVNGTSSADYYEGNYEYDKLDNNDLHQNHVLGFNERRLTSLQFNGDHQFESLLGLRLDWKASFAQTKQDEPDLRYFTTYLKIDDDGTTPGVFNNLVPQRYYRYLNEDNNEFSANFSLPFKQWNGHKSTLKFGALYSDKSREFDEVSYSYSGYNGYYGDPESYFSDSNMEPDSSVVVINGVEWVTRDLDLYIEEGDIGANDYSGEKIVNAQYLMVDLPLTADLRFIGGARYERTDMELISADHRKENGKISTKDVLPSINFIYSLAEDMNLRLSATRSLARPTLRELAPYASYDFVVGFTAIGNPELKRTLIDNYDIRWEWFSRPGEIYAVSAFYKNFQDPIERAFIVSASNREITWKNVDEAKTMGVEFEVRKKLDIISPRLRNFMVGSNLSLVHSEVQIPADELALIRIKRPDFKGTRELEGQSPFLLNFNLGYDNYDKGIFWNVYYNVFGERLSEVSKDGTPFVYEQPVNTLNANFSMRITNNIKFKLSGKNLLDAEFKKTHEYEGTEYIFRNYTKGRTFSMGFAYSL